MDYKPRRANAFMLFSLLFGIAAIISCSLIITSFIFGGLAILFAVLSKGDDEKVTGTALGGMITGICGIILSIVLCASVIYLIFNDSSYRKLLNDTCEQMYGITFDEMLEGEMPDMDRSRSIDDML